MEQSDGHRYSIFHLRIKVVFRLKPRSHDGGRYGSLATTEYTISSTQFVSLNYF